MTRVECPCSAVPFHKGDRVRLPGEDTQGVVRYIERDGRGVRTGRYVVECAEACFLAHGAQMVLLPRAAPVFSISKLTAGAR